MLESQGETNIIHVKKNKRKVKKLDKREQKVRVLKAANPHKTMIVNANEKQVALVNAVAVHKSVLAEFEVNYKKNNKYCELGTSIRYYWTRVKMI